jgi:hypothetical protein
MTNRDEGADQGCGPGEPSELLVQLPDGQKASVGGDRTALEISDEFPMLMEAEGQLTATACHLKAPPAVDSESRPAPSVAAQEGFPLPQAPESDG